MKKLILLFLVVLMGMGNLQAQQKIGYIDSEKIFSELPEYQDALNKLQTQSMAWKKIIAQKKTALDSLFKDYQSKEILYTQDIKAEKQQAIALKEKEITTYQNQKFGVNGEYFSEQSKLMKPIQTKLFNALKMIADEEDYDFIFDRSSEMMLLYTNSKFNLTQKALEILKGNVILEDTLN